MNFYLPEHVKYGRDSVLKNALLLKELGRRCLIVTGRSSAKRSGAFDDAVSALNSCGIDFFVFDEIGENPLVDTCFNAGAAARNFGADFIFGIGGGSVLDAAKAAAIFTSSSISEPMKIYERKATSPLPLALCGTTAGTGSEVTGVSVLTDGKTGRKKSISGEDCRASLVFADAKYTFSLPFDITVSTALDALAHALEGRLSPKCTETEIFLARECVPVLINLLRQAQKNGTLPNESQRDEIYLASLHAGLIINTCSTLFPHPLGYVLTENYGVPHGKACAAFMPELLRRAQQVLPEVFSELSTLLGDAESAMQAVSELAGCSSLNIGRAQSEAFALRWEKDPPKNFALSPGGMTAKEAAEILDSQTDTATRSG